MSVVAPEEFVFVRRLLGRGGWRSTPLNQDELGRALGSSRKTVSRRERGIGGSRSDLFALAGLLLYHGHTREALELLDRHRAELGANGHPLAAAASSAGE